MERALFCLNKIVATKYGRDHDPLETCRTYICTARNPLLSGLIVKHYSKSAMIGRTRTMHKRVLTLFLALVLTSGAALAQDASSSANAVANAGVADGQPQAAPEPAPQPASQEQNQTAATAESGNTGVASLPFFYAFRACVPFNVLLKAGSGDPGGECIFRRVFSANHASSTQFLMTYTTFVAYIRR